MNTRCLLSLTSLLVSLAALFTWQDASTPPTKPAPAAVDEAERADDAARLEDLAFLAGEWRGTDGSSTWASWYSSPEGGQVLGASKELRGGRVVMIDFEQFYLDGGKLAMTPYPFGNRSVAFTLSDFSRSQKRAVFANETHDFPQRFTYHRSADDRLDITLEGDMGSGPMTVEIALTRATR